MLVKNRQIRLLSPSQPAGLLSLPCRAQGEARRAARPWAGARGLLLACHCLQGWIITLSPHYRASLHRLSRGTSAPPCQFLQFAWKDSPFLPCGLDSRYPPTPEPLKAVPRRVAQPRVQRAGTARLPGCGQALPLPPALCGCGPGAGNTPPFGRGRGGLEARFHPSPVWERAEKSTAKLSAGSPEGLPVCRLVSNAQMP